MPAGRASWRLSPASGGVSVFWLVCVGCPLVLSVAHWCNALQEASTERAFIFTLFTGVRWCDAVELRPILYIKLSLVAESATEGVCMTRCSCD